MGEVEKKNEKSKSPLRELAFLLASIKGKVHPKRQRFNSVAIDKVNIEGFM